MSCSGRDDRNGRGDFDRNDFGQDDEFGRPLNNDPRGGGEDFDRLNEFDDEFEPRSEFDDGGLEPLNNDDFDDDFEPRNVGGGGGRGDRYYGRPGN